jgi:hypothetical protein
MSTMIENVVTAKYDAEHRTLHLARPLFGASDGAEVRVHVHVPLPTAATVDPDQRRDALSGIMSEEDGKDFADAINEMFPPWND